VRVIPDTIIQSVNAALDQRAGGGDWLQLESGMLLVATAQAGCPGRERRQP